MEILGMVFKLDELYYSVEVTAFALTTISVLIPSENISLKIELSVSNLELKTNLRKRIN